MIASRSAFRVFLFVLTLFPVIATAQTTVQSFDALASTLKPGTNVVVTDRAGRKTKGKIAELSATSVVLSMGSPAGNRPGRQSQARARQAAFGLNDVAEIRKIDSVRNGLAIGAVVGTVLGVYMAALATPDSQSSVSGGVTVFAIGVGGGALTGMLIDAARVGGPIVYRSPQTTGRVRVAPLIRKERRGVLISLRS